MNLGKGNEVMRCGYKQILIDAKLGSEKRV